MMLAISRIGLIIYLNDVDIQKSKAIQEGIVFLWIIILSVFFI